MHRTILTICGCATLATALTARIALADAADSSEALAEITVTAEKQSQNLQKTAAAVTAISAETLLDAGVTDLRAAQKLVPSVRFQAEGNNTQVFIRGVGANLDQANVEPNVAFNFAGTYLPREATSAGFFDVEQFEVLPGPQGTLYGRSAIGGTINVTPHAAWIQRRRRRAAGRRQLYRRACNGHTKLQGKRYARAASRC
jgi:iron complex outermembrane receptor protein